MKASGLRITGQTVFTAFLFALVLLFVVQAFSFSPQGQRLPLIVGIPTLLLLALQLAADAWPSRVRLTKEQDVFGVDKVRDEAIHTGEPAAGMADSGTAPAGAEAAPAPQVVFRREMKMAGWVIGYGLFMYLFGALLGLVIFNFLFLLAERERFGLNVAVTAGSWAFTYVLFDLILQVPLNPGVLFGG